MEKFSKEQLEKYAFDELDEVEDRELLDRMGADLIDNPDGQVSLYFRKREEENSRCFDLDWERLLGMAENDDEAVKSDPDHREKVEREVGVWKRPMPRVLIGGISLAVVVLVALTFPFWTNGSKEIGRIEDVFGEITKYDRGRIRGVEAYPERWQPQIVAMIEKEVVPLPVEELADLQSTRSATMQRHYLMPVGTIVQSQSPDFQWKQGLEDDEYEVLIWNLRNGDEENATSSGKVTTLSWTPEKRLQRGQSYAWKIRLHNNGETAFWNESPSRFRVLSESSFAQLAAAEAEAQGSHIVLALIYLEHGLLDDAEVELRALLDDNPESAIAKALAGSLPRGADR